MTTTNATRLTYPISPSYVKGWTSERAIAELVANAIDEKVDFSFEWSDGTLVIEDEGPGIPEEGMILGITDKSDDQIGQFGEGKKIAALVLARSNKIGSVRFETVGYAFTPTITQASFIPEEFRREGSTAPEVLAYDIEKHDRVKGTRIIIECDEDLAEAVKRRFLHFNDGYVAPNSPGAIVPGEQGNIYIGGVLVSTNPDLIFSYDFSLVDAKHFQNRDRTVLDAWSVKRLISAILRNETDPVILRKWLSKALFESIDEAERAFFDPSPKQRVLISEIGSDILKEQYPDETPCFITGHDSVSQEQALDLTDRGYRIIDSNLSKHEHSALMNIIGVKSVKAESKKIDRGEKETITTWVKDSDLTPDEKKILDKAAHTVRAVWGALAIDKLRVYSETKIIDSDTHLRWGGFYQPKNGLIALHRDNLQHFSSTLEVLTHEAAHRLRHMSENGRNDYRTRSRGFESQLCSMASTAAQKIVEAGLNGKRADSRPAKPVKGDPPVDVKGYEDRTYGFEYQLTQMAAGAAETLLEAGEVPDEADVARQQREMKEKLANRPINRLLREIDKRIADAGYKTMTSYAKSIGVPSAWVSGIRSGTKRKALAINQERLEAFTNGIDMRWQIVALCIAGTNIPSAKRVKSGELWGSTVRSWFEKILDDLSSWDDIPSEVIDQIRLHSVDESSIITENDEWLEPYSKLLEIEFARN